jgi:flavin-dependent dehydrogenase
MRPPDVLIVGAGPAGAWTARCLALAGARVRLFDHSHPREKPCGGGVTGRALSLIDGVLDPAMLDGVGIEHGIFEDPRTMPAAVSLAERSRRDATLTVVDRSRFDRALLAAACEAGAIRLGGSNAQRSIIAATHRAMLVPEST